MVGKICFLLFFTKIAFLSMVCTTPMVQALGEQSQITAVCFAKDCSRIAVALKPNMVCLLHKIHNNQWQLADIFVIDSFNQSAITAINFNPKHEGWITLGTAQGNIIFLKRLHHNHYKIASQVTIPKMENGIKSIVYSDDEAILYLQSQDNQGLVLLKKNNAWEQQIFYSHSAAFTLQSTDLNNISYSLSIGNNIVVEKKDITNPYTTIEHISVKLAEKSVYMNPHLATFSKEGEFLAGVFLNNIIIWRYDIHKNLFSSGIKLTIHEGEINNLCFRFDKKYFAAAHVADDLKKILIWSNKEGKWVRDSAIEYQAQPIAGTLQFSENNEYLICGFDNNTIALWMQPKNEPQVEQKAFKANKAVIIIQLNDVIEKNNSLIQKITFNSPQQNKPILPLLDEGSKISKDTKDFQSQEKSPEFTFQEVSESINNRDRERKIQKEFEGEKETAKQNKKWGQFFEKKNQWMAMKKNTKKLPIEPRAQHRKEQERKTWGNWFREIFLRQKASSSD